MFDELTLGQPQAPPDRYSMIRRRARRQRLTRAAATLGVAAAVAAVAIGIATTSPSPVPPASKARHVPGWALPWPDHRNGSVRQREASCCRNDADQAEPKGVLHGFSATSGYSHV